MIPFLLGLKNIVGDAKSWYGVKNWLKELENELKEAGIEDYAGGLFCSREGNVVRLVHRIYYKENGKWVEKTAVREIDESEVPDWFKEGLTAKEKDVTELYEKI